MKNLLKLSFLICLMYSCSNEEYEPNNLDTEVSSLTYEYRGQVYSANEFKKEHSNLFLNSHQVYDLDRNAIIFFEDKQKADGYKAFDQRNLMIPKDSVKREKVVNLKNVNYCDPFFSYGVTFYEYKGFKGKSIRFIKNNIDVRKNLDGVVYALPNHWKNRISSFKAYSSNQVFLKYPWGCGVEPTRLVLEDANKDHQHIFDIMDYDIWQAKTQVPNLKGDESFGDLDLNNNIDNFGIVVYAF